MLFPSARESSLAFSFQPRFASFVEIDGNAIDAARRHDNSLSTLAELRMTKRDLMRTDRQREIRQWRLADHRTVNQHVCPRPRVHVHECLRRIDLDGGDL